MTEIGRLLVEDYLALVDDSCVAVLPHVLRVTVDLGLPEALAAGPRTVDDLAEAVRADPDALFRLLRALASVGVLAEEERRRFLLPETGHRLRADTRNSVRESVRNSDSQLAWLRALDTVRTGRSAFDGVHGDGFFAHKNVDDEANRSFLRRMRERAARLYPEFVTDTDWSHCDTVMDIGGGDGYQLDRILRQAEHLTGVLFDRPAVIDAVRADGDLAGLGERCQLAEGDFFEALPDGADTTYCAACCTTGPTKSPGRSSARPSGAG